MKDSLLALIISFFIFNNTFFTKDTRTDPPCSLQRKHPKPLNPEQLATPDPNLTDAHKDLSGSTGYKEQISKLQKSFFDSLSSEFYTRFNSPPEDTPCCSYCACFITCFKYLFCQGSTSCDPSTEYTRF